MSVGLGEIHVDSVDGVPLLWIDGPPPFAMFLMFRVGQADENLQTAGITHLIEHLAFPHDHANTDPNNGSTELTRTRFFAWGDSSDAADFLHRVSVSLQRPPVDRIPQQRDIIHTEESRWAITPVGELLIERYGAVRHGGAGFRQLGLDSLGSDQIRAWVTRFFTQGNAILCMTGPPPSRLALELPEGPPVPAPMAEALDAPYPRWTRKQQPYVGMGFVSPHDAAAGTAMRILEKRLYNRLRTQGAMSYAVQADAQLLDGKTAHRTIVADCLEDAAPKVTDMMIAAAYELADGGPTKSELAEGLKEMERQLRDDPRAIAGWMLHAADCYLNAVEVDEFEEYLEKRRALTTQEVHDAWRAAIASLIVCIPPWVDIRDPRFVVPAQPIQVTGRTFHPPGLARLKGGTRAVLGATGFSLVGTKGDQITSMFADVVALLRPRPLHRILISRNGLELGVDGSSFAAGDELVVGIDQAIPQDRWISFGREW